MTEGKRCQIVLLDDRTLEFLVQPRLLAGDLLDIVASHFSLHEKEYFGLCFLDETAHRNWLRLEKRVLDHEFPKGVSPIELIFSVRNYCQSITLLKETKTIELFYYQAKTLIFKGDLECDNETVFLLAAYVLQATQGDYVNESIGKEDLKKLQVIPMRTLTAHPSLPYCEEKVLVHYKRMSGLPRGEAIVNYLSIVERLPMYGVHYYDVKNKQNLPWKLGLSHKGIGQYDHGDKKIPRKIYMWARMENLFYRDKKFSVEIRDLARSGSSHSINSISRLSAIRRSPGQHIKVVTWFCSNASLCREIWLMAVGQHQFYMEKSEAQRSLRQRTLKEIAKELSRSSTSLASSLGSDISGSMCDCNSNYNSVDGGDSGTASADMISALQARKEVLEQLLLEKIQDLRSLCLREAEITGKVPEETPDGPNDGPSRRKVGTTFVFSESVLSSSGNGEELERLQQEYEIQVQITNAGHRLAGDSSVSKKVRKARTMLYQKALVKLKTMEQQLDYVRKEHAHREKNNYSLRSRSSSKDDLISTDSLGPFDPVSSSRSSLDSVPKVVSQQWEKRQLSRNDNGSDDFTPPDTPSIEITEQLEEIQFPNNGKENSGQISTTPLRRSYSVSTRPSVKVRQRKEYMSSTEDIYDPELPASGNQYLLGEFGNSGIYSNFNNPKKVNPSLARVMNISSSTSRLEKAAPLNPYTNRKSASMDELERDYASSVSTEDTVPFENRERSSTDTEIFNDVQHEEDFDYYRSNTVSFGESPSQRQWSTPESTDKDPIFSKPPLPLNAAEDTVLYENPETSPGTDVFDEEDFNYRRSNTVSYSEIPIQRQWSAPASTVKNPMFSKPPLPPNTANVPQSYLLSAAWSQLSQPSMEQLVQQYLPPIPRFQDQNGTILSQNPQPYSPHTPKRNESMLSINSEPSFYSSRNQSSNGGLLLPISRNQDPNGSILSPNSQTPIHSRTQSMCLPSRPYIPRRRPAYQRDDAHKVDQYLTPQDRVDPYNCVKPQRNDEEGKQWTENFAEETLV